MTVPLGILLVQVAGTMGEAAEILSGLAPEMHMQARLSLSRAVLV